MLGIIVPLGILCNTLSIVTFTGSRYMRKQSASWYLGALAITDNVALICEMVRTWMPNSRIGIGWYHKYLGVCLTTAYVSVIARFVSAWIIVLFTAERAFCILHPLQGKFAVGNISFTKKCLGALLCVASLSCIYMFFYIRVENINGVNLCRPNSATEPTYNSITYAMITIMGFVPMILILVMNFLMIGKLTSIKKLQKIVFNGRYEGQSMDKGKITLMLMVVSTVYVILTAPYTVTWLYASLLDIDPNIEEDLTNFYLVESILAILRAFYMLNYAVNLLLYSITGSRFRQELYRILCCMESMSIMECDRSTRKSTIRKMSVVSLQNWLRRKSVIADINQANMEMKVIKEMNGMKDIKEQNKINCDENNHNVYNEINQNINWISSVSEHNETTA